MLLMQLLEDDSALLDQQLNCSRQNSQFPGASENIWLVYVKWKATKFTLQ